MVERQRGGKGTPANEERLKVGERLAATQRRIAVGWAGPRGSGAENDSSQRVRRCDGHAAFLVERASNGCVGRSSRRAAVRWFASQVLSGKTPSVTAEMELRVNWEHFPQRGRLSQAIV